MIAGFMFGPLPFASVGGRFLCVDRSHGAGGEDLVKRGYDGIIVGFHLNRLTTPCGGENKAAA